MTPKLPGRRRLEIVADPEFIDAVAAAAARRRLSVSAWIRLVLSDAITKSQPRRPRRNAPAEPSTDPAP